MLTERKAAGLAVRRAQARASAESGMEMTRLFLLQDRETQIEDGGWYDNPERFRGVLVIDDGTQRGRGRFSIVAPRMEDGRLGGIRFGLEDESTRLNLNTLLLADEASEKGGREILMGLPGMTEQIADAILDWIDPDDDPREFGAEVDEYSSLDPPYAPKNGPLETVEELLLVRGVTPWLLFGPDANRNGRIDPDEPNPETIDGIDNSDGAMNQGWAAYLTLYSLESNLRPDGSPKINLNQEDMKQLHKQLEEVFDSRWATFIVAYRQNGPYTGSKRGEMTASGRLDLSVPGKVPLSTVIDLIGPRVRVKFKGEEQPTVLETPFPNVPGMMNSYLPVLMDYVTINASPVIPGRININQASRTVLSGIPGMSEETIDAIMSQRQENPVEAQPHRRHETWILSEGIVTLEEMKALMPFVTGGGSVFRAQWVGYFERGGPPARIEAVLDATIRPARVISWRDISHLGRGYALETLGTEAAEMSPSEKN